MLRQAPGGYAVYKGKMYSAGLPGNTDNVILKPPEGEPPPGEFVYDPRILPEPQWRLYLTSEVIEAAWKHKVTAVWHGQRFDVLEVDGDRVYIDVIQPAVPLEELQRAGLNIDLRDWWAKGWVPFGELEDVVEEDVDQMERLALRRAQRLSGESLW